MILILAVLPADKMTPLSSPPRLPRSYFKRPWAIEGIVKEYSACRDVLPSELLINVDSPDKAAEWVKHVYPSEGFVVPVFSFNLHETRGYNRLAGIARGEVIIILQVSGPPVGVQAAPQPARRERRS